MRDPSSRETVRSADPATPRARHAARPGLALLFDDVNLRLCAAFTLVFALMPPDGLGFDTCGCKFWTGAPCPGCGMTRSGANLVRGHVGRAIHYHPFGVLVIPAIAALGAVGLMPRRWRDKVRAALLPRAARLRPLWWTALGGFLLYGVGRWLCVVAGLAEFPATWP